MSLVYLALQRKPSTSEESGGRCLVLVFCLFVLNQFQEALTQLT